MRRAPAAQAKVKAQRKKPSYPAKLIERRRRVVSRTGGRFGLDALNARKPKKKEMDRGRVEGKMKGEGKERSTRRNFFIVKLRVFTRPQRIKKNDLRSCCRRSAQRLDALMLILELPKKIVS